MSRPRLLDLFCGAGYPFEFHQGDALKYLLEHWEDFDAFHASPPCQAFTPLSALPHAGAKRTPVDHIPATRSAFSLIGRPWVIENVPQAPIAGISDLLGRHGVTLCGTQFGLRIFRHRKFEANFPLAPLDHPRHQHLAMRAGYLPTEERPYMSIHGRGGHNSRAWVAKAAEVMDVPWMASDLDAVCEAIPPVYTEYIGHQLIDHLRSAAA